jgi:hypothetical protein
MEMEGASLHFHAINASHQSISAIEQRSCTIALDLMRSCAAHEIHAHNMRMIDACVAAAGINV